MTTESATTTCVTASRLSSFLSRYAAAMLGCGATCIRLTRNVDRIAGVMGMKVEITIMPRHIHLSVINPQTGELLTTIESMSKCGISFNVNTRLSQLSWEIADGKIGFDEAERRFEDIMTHDGQNPLMVLVLASLANASFCRLFGGDLAAMAVVFIATAAGYYIKQQMLARKCDLRVTVFVCAFVSSVIAAADSLFALGGTPSIALATSALYLVPGIPFLNSFSDMLYRHYICSFSRFIDATVITCCLSAGLCLGMLLMKAGMF